MDYTGKDSNCCGARMTGDICGECKEHCVSIEEDLCSFKEKSAVVREWESGVARKINKLLTEGNNAKRS